MAKKKVKIVRKKPKPKKKKRFNSSRNKYEDKEGDLSNSEGEGSRCEDESNWPGGAQAEEQAVKIHLQHWNGSKDGGAKGQEE